jgi:GTP-binding protein
MLEYLAASGLPALFALTKVDKLKPAERRKQVAAILADLGAGEEQAIPFSALNGEGRDDLLESIGGLLEHSGGEA